VVVTLEHRVEVRPATRDCHGFDRVVRSFRPPLSAVRMTRSVNEFW
jgi:hypothetical protein